MAQLWSVASTRFGSSHFWGHSVGLAEMLRGKLLCGVRIDFWAMALISHGQPGFAVFDWVTLGNCP